MFDCALHSGASTLLDNATDRLMYDRNVEEDSMLPNDSIDARQTNVKSVLA